MFALGTGIFKEITKRDEYFVLVCGPESSGKTTFAEQFRVQCDPKFSMPRRTTSTMGLNLVKFHVDGFVLNFWDVGGNKDLQTLWDKYIEDCHAIVFVVDSYGDADNYDSCFQALNKVMSFEQAKKVPLMIVLNKCDLLDDTHKPCSKSPSGTFEDNSQSSDNSAIKPSGSSIRLEQNGRPIEEDAVNGNGWTSQDDADYDAYKAYGWEQPDFIPPPTMRTPSQCSISTTSSMESSKKSTTNMKQTKMLSRTQQIQHLGDVCQDLCEQVNPADMTRFTNQN